MKQEIHPEYHEITVIMTDGTELAMRSTYAKPGERLQLDIDAKTHPAWTGTQRMVDRGSQLAKFNKRFGGITAKKAEGEAAEAPAAKKEDKIKLTTTATPTAKKKKA